jgi:hypothetical protein
MVPSSAIVAYKVSIEALSGVEEVYGVTEAFQASGPNVELILVVEMLILQPCVPISRYIWMLSLYPWIPILQP